MMRMDPKEYQTIMARNPKLKAHGWDQKQKSTLTVPPAPAGKKGPKYWNVKVYVYANGLVTEERNDKFGKPVAVYDSRREYKMAVILERRATPKNGNPAEITELRRQVAMELEPAGEYRGEKIRAERYVADFRFKDQDGKEYVLDVKGYDEEAGKFRTTELFRSKWNRLKRRYPEIEFLLIDPVAGKQQ